jgi:TrpR-related protein YerC/YecD
MYTGRLRGLEGLEDLFKAVLSLRDVEECYRLFDDLCTVSELRALSQRYAVAGLILKGAKYEDIERVTGASSATISRVKRFVEYGAGGYQLAHERDGADGGDS